jgi:uncharacterized protein (UPF0332 family)
LLVKKVSLEELLRSRVIRRIKPNHGLAVNSLKRAQRDIGTAKTLIENEKYDWSLAISYNAMLQAGRALMFERGFRPSSTEGHVAVVKFLHAILGKEASDRMVLVLNGMRKKRHRIVYEEMDIVSQSEAEQSMKWAEKFVSTVDKIITRRAKGAA